VLLRLYTDRVPAGTQQAPGPEGAIQLRNEQFKNHALPFYAVVSPKGDQVEVITTYERGLIKSVEEFAGYLQGSLDKYRRS
jgi:hypothetical protein